MIIMASFEYGNRRIEYEVIRSKRKTLGICIRQGDVIIKAPFGITKEQIHSLILLKANWIVRKLEENEPLWKKNEEKIYQEGTIIKYRGRDLRIRIIPSTQKKARVTLEGMEIIIATSVTSSEAIKGVVNDWYYEKARERFKERVDYYVHEVPEVQTPNQIRIKDQKTRWGSCSSKRNLNFNYRIVMAPDEVLDYIVVHELSHIKFMNHSKEFWKEVARILPNYQNLRLWLRKNQSSLEIL